MKIEREKDPRVSDGMVGMTRRRGRIGSRGFSFGKNLADWALFFRETTVPLYPFVLEMLISRSGCSFRWLFGGIGVDPKPAFPTRITFDPVLEMLISRSLLIVVESAFCPAYICRAATASTIHTSTVRCRSAHTMVRKHFTP